MNNVNLSDEIKNLQDLHAAGVLTDTEFASAKATVLAGGPVHKVRTDSGPVERQLEQIRLQKELERLDREWVLEQEKYMVMGRGGGRSIPTEAGSIIGALVVGVFGLTWTILAGAMFPPLALFGICFVAIGVGNCLSGLDKAGKYKEAYANYQQRRADFLAKHSRDGH